MVKTEQKITDTSPSSSISSSSSSKPMASSSKATSPSSSSACRKKKYKGVRMRSWGSWVSEIRAPNQKTRIWLGSYSTAEAAARAYDAALLCLKGSSANLNFPISASAHFIPQGEITNMSPKSIQRVAAAAANSFLADDNNDVIPTPTNNNVSSPSSSPPPPSPPIHSSSSSSIVSSPSMSSSPLNLVDDDMSSLMGSFDTSFGSYTPTYDHDHQLPIMSTMEPWSNFVDGLQYSPKYLDQMLNGALFDPPTTYDFYEDCDIPLWSFC